MRKFIICLFSIFIALSISAQVGIGTEAPDVSSILNVVSSDKGVLMPRMTSAQRNTIENPADGLCVYDTDESRFFYFNQKSNAWDKVGTLSDIEGGQTPGQPEPSGKKPKNIIFMIGDGMSHAQVYAAYKRNIEKGGGVLTMTTFPYTGIVTTYSNNNFTTDSAAGGTALSSGVKTNNKYVGVDPSGNSVKSIADEAKERGLSTGIVVTSSVTHATPACFYAHNKDRNANTAIANDFLKSDVDVCIGGGSTYFSSALKTQLTNKGYEITTTLDKTLTSTSNKILGLLASAHMPWAATRGNMLPQATQKALDILSKNEKGFFLMVEGSQIDIRQHDYTTSTPSDPPSRSKMVEELVDFDNAIKVAKDFAEKDGNTLIIVTADHETGGLVLYNNATDANKLGWHFTITSSANYTYVKGAHTATPVPSFAYGPGSENFSGFFDNTEFKSRIMKLLSFTK